VANDFGSASYSSTNQRRAGFEQYGARSETAHVLVIDLSISSVVPAWTMANVLSCYRSNRHRFHTQPSGLGTAEAFLALTTIGVSVRQGWRIGWMPSGKENEPIETGQGGSESPWLVLWRISVQCLWK